MHFNDGCTCHGRQWGPPPRQPARIRLRLLCLLLIPPLLLAGPHAHQLAKSASVFWHSGPQVSFDLPDLASPTSTTRPARGER